MLKVVFLIVNNIKKGQRDIHLAEAIRTNFLSFYNMQIRRSCRVTQTQLNNLPISPPAVWLTTIINMFDDGVNLQLHEGEKKNKGANCVR